MGWAADAKGRIVFLETSIREPAVTRAEMDKLAASGYFKGCAGVVFGDMAAGGPNRTRLAGKALAAAREEMAKIRKDFAAKASFPVYEAYPYGHVSISYAIDFLREKTITADGILKQ
jgi:muramoyltetrapeptide carboxypeptidase LdcA involved in peptidoglycan recycling